MNYATRINGDDCMVFWTGTGQYKRRKDTPNGTWRKSEGEAHDNDYIYLNLRQKPLTLAKIKKNTPQ